MHEVAAAVQAQWAMWTCISLSTCANANNFKPTRLGKHKILVAPRACASFTDVIHAMQQCETLFVPSAA